MPTGKTYNPAHLKLHNGSIDFANDDIRLLIVSDSYTFDKTHEFVSSITNEVTNFEGTGYERKILANLSISLVGDDVVYDADNPTYSAINTNEELAAGIVYKQVTDDTDSEVLFYVEFLNSEGNASPLPTNGSDVQPQISDDGIAKVENVLV